MAGYRPNKLGVAKTIISSRSEAGKMQPSYPESKTLLFDEKSCVLFLVLVLAQTPRTVGYFVEDEQTEVNVFMCSSLHPFKFDKSSMICQKCTNTLT